MSEKTPMEWVALCDATAPETPGPYHMHEGDLVNEQHEDVYWAEDDSPNAVFIVNAVNAYPHLAKALRRAVETIDEFLINEGCSCVRTGDHPCPRCVITIDEARALLRELGVKDDGDNTNS